MLERLPGMRLDDAMADLQAKGVECKPVEYIAPGRERQGNDFRVIRARLVNGCAELIYAGFITDIEDRV